MSDIFGVCDTIGDYLGVTSKFERFLEGFCKENYPKTTTTHWKKIFYTTLRSLSSLLRIFFGEFRGVISGVFGIFWGVFGGDFGEALVVILVGFSEVKRLTQEDFLDYLPT